MKYSLIKRLFLTLLTLCIALSLVFSSACAEESFSFEAEEIIEDDGTLPDTNNLGISLFSFDTRLEVISDDFTGGAIVLNFENSKELPAKDTETTTYYEPYKDLYGSALVSTESNTLMSLSINSSIASGDADAFYKQLDQYKELISIYCCSAYAAQTGAISESEVNNYKKTISDALSNFDFSFFTDAMLVEGIENEFFVGDCYVDFLFSADLNSPISLNAYITRLPQ